MKEKLGVIEAADRAQRTQPLTEEQEAFLDEAEALFYEFKTDTQTIRDRVRDNRKIYLLEDPYQDVKIEQNSDGEYVYTSSLAGGEPPTIQLHTLQSTINNCAADQMDNLPDPVLFPEVPQLQPVAEDMTDVARYILYHNEYPEIHKKRTHDTLIAGVAVTQVVWDDDAADGKGDVCIFRYPIENIYWDPSAQSVQECRAIFKASFHNHGWYQMHYPDLAQYVGDDIGDASSEAPEAQKSDELIMLLEYWYRKWDDEKKRYQIHVAHLAGGALLYMSEDKKPAGVYKHGMYPFVFDVHTPIEGTPVGNSMIYEYAPMQRYINRYAKYIDANTRAAAHGKIIVARTAGIDRSAVSDWDTQVVESDYLDSVKPFQPLALPTTAQQMMAQFQSDMKQDSGQNQFNRGEGGKGVTAASAIALLQEAGGKTARLLTATLNVGFTRIVEQILWLVHEFYSEDRVQMVTGKDGKAKAMNRTKKELFGGLTSPKYSVQVQIQRKNPMIVQSQNEFIMSFANVCAQANTPIPPDVLLEMLQVDGKDTFMPRLREIMGQQNQMAQMTQAIQQQGQQMQAMQDQLAKANQVIQQQAEQVGGMYAGQTETSA